MNSILEQELPGTVDLRDQLLDVITDQDLGYKLPGANPTLGELCQEMGYIQQVYIHSFTTFTQDWGYRDSQPESPMSVANLKAWYQQLDGELEAALRELSEDDIHSRQIDRGHGFTVTPYVQFQVYREALLIFYAKASVFLKALDRQVSEQWDSWIG